MSTTKDLVTEVSIEDVKETPTDLENAFEDVEELPEVSEKDLENYLRCILGGTPFSLSYSLSKDKQVIFTEHTGDDLLIFKHLRDAGVPSYTLNLYHIAFALSSCYRELKPFKYSEDSPEDSLKEYLKQFSESEINFLLSKYTQFIQDIQDLSIVLAKGDF